MKKSTYRSIGLSYRTWKSPRILAKASKEQKELQTEQADFYKTLTQNYAQQFKNQSAILSSLQSAFAPILGAGINQYGFSTAEDTALRTQASDAIARNQASAQTALNNQLASRGGGNAFIPSGAEAQLQAGLLANAANQQSQTSLGITEAGYAQGRQNFLSAEGALMGAAGMYNPTSYGGLATNTGNSAFNMATTVNQENNAWKGALGGILGGVAGAFLGPVGSALGSAVGGALGGGSEYDPTIPLTMPTFSGGGGMDTATAGGLYG